MIGWVRKHHRKIREIGTGIFIWESFNFVFDFIFYPFALVYWRLFWGGITAVTLSFISNAFVFWLYEYMAVDWLGAHALRELEDEENKSALAKLMTWFGKKKTTIWEKILSPIVFVGLLLPIDPVIIAIHYRRQHYKGVGWRVWGIFFVATAVANGWWLLKVGLVVEFALYVWHLIF
jgi:hypothetical protein